MRPQLDNSLIVDPLPLELKYFKIDKIPYKGHKVKVELEYKKFRVYIDGILKKESLIGKAVNIKLDEKD